MVDNHLIMKEEYERQKQEQEGHPDDIYLKKPQENSW